MALGLDFSIHSRPRFLQESQSITFDLLIIGGGITGAGIALDAASRGLRVCLVEKSDFASGTSSKSTKLIHGGLRYLKQFEFGLVREVGKERAVLHQLAPHLVIPEKMIIPIIKGGSLGKTMTSIGLYIYDFLADVQGSDKRRMLEVDELREMEPLLPVERLMGGSIYAEYRTDDARLTIEVLKTAYRYGALPLNYLKCEEILTIDGKAAGAVCLDQTTGKRFKIQARMMVNATGPWVDMVRALVEPVTGKRLYLTKGVHLVVPRQKLPIKHAVYFDVPGDERMIFAIPRLGVTYIGTTDTYYSGNPDQVDVEKEDVDYLLRAVNQTFDIPAIHQSDILSRWAGLRPLIYEDNKSASEISRRDEIFESSNGMLSIAGGKLTGYRKMAERITDMVVEKLYPDERENHPCKTEEIKLTIPFFNSHQEYESCEENLQKICHEKGLDPLYGTYLIQNYGSIAVEILNKLNSNDHPESELVNLELDYCVHNEMIVKPMDFLARRTGRLFFMPESIPLVQARIFQYFAAHLGWQDHDIIAETSDWIRTLDSLRN